MSESWFTDTGTGTGSGLLLCIGELGLARKTRIALMFARTENAPPSARVHRCTALALSLARRRANARVTKQGCLRRKAGQCTARLSLGRFLASRCVSASTPLHTEKTRRERETGRFCIREFKRLAKRNMPKFLSSLSLSLSNHLIKC